MSPEQKLLANKAIENNVEDTTVRQIIRYVMECELWGQDIISPTNEYLAKKYNWKKETVERAMSLAKKSQFITTSGTRKNRLLELNQQFLAIKIGEIVSQIAIQKARKSMSMDTLIQLATNLVPKELPKESLKVLPKELLKVPTEEYSPTEPQNLENRGYNNNNSNNNIGETKVSQAFQEVKEGDEEREPKDKPATKRYEEICRWAEARRGFKFVNRIKQYASLKKAKQVGISVPSLKERWIKCEGEVWRDGQDWCSVVSSFDKMK